MKGDAALTAEVRTHLEKILASAQFVNAGRLSRFLRFAVEQTLAGQGAHLKEYVVGREVFDRGDGYDPRTDPVVRVEARRLRAKIEEYYRGEGQNDRLRIAFRKGSYAPVFDRRGEIPARSYRRWVIAAGALAAGAICAFVYFQSPWTAGARSEVLAVLPAADLDPAPPGGMTPAGLAEAVSVELARQGRVRVVAWPEAQRARASASSNAGIARELGANKLLLLSVRRDSGQIRVFAHLLDPAGGRTKLWGADYERMADNAATERELARVIAEELGAAWDRLSRGSG